jgi:hypothetical protein
MGGNMKITYALLLLAVASVTASGQATVPKQAEDVKQPFTLTIGSSPTNPTLEDTGDETVKAGDSMVLRIRKTNISNQEIPVRPHGCLLQYDLRDSSGSPVVPKKSNDLPGGLLKGVQPAGHPVMLQPGESKIDFEPVSDGFEIDQPGTYSIQVSECISSDPSSEVVQSNKIKITVLPPDPPADAPK